MGDPALKLGAKGSKLGEEVCEGDDFFSKNYQMKERIKASEANVCVFLGDSLIYVPWHPWHSSLAQSSEHQFLKSVFQNETIVLQ